MVELTHANQLLITSCTTFSLMLAATADERRTLLQMVDEVLPGTDIAHPAIGPVVEAARHVVNNWKIGADRNSRSAAETRLRITLHRYFERCGAEQYDAWRPEPKSQQRR